MADKEKKPEFVVTDRRLFRTDGELRQDVVEDQERRAERERETTAAQQRVNDERAAVQQQTAEARAAENVTTLPNEMEAEAPSTAEQQASAAAYKESTRHIDEQ